MPIKSERNSTVGALESSRIFSSRSVEIHFPIDFFEVQKRTLMRLKITFSYKTNFTRITPKGTLKIVYIYVKSQ